MQILLNAATGVTLSIRVYALYGQSKVRRLRRPMLHVKAGTHCICVQWILFGLIPPFLGELAVEAVSTHLPSLCEPAELTDR